MNSLPGVVADLPTLAYQLALGFKRQVLASGFSHDVGIWVSHAEIRLSIFQLSTAAFRVESCRNDKLFSLRFWL